MNDDNYFKIIIHFNDKTLDYKMKSDMSTWTDDDMVKMRKSIQKRFNLNNEFDLYEQFGDDKLDIDDIGDIKNAFDYDSDSEQEEQKEQKDENDKILDLYVKVNLYNYQCIYVFIKMLLVYIYTKIIKSKWIKKNLIKKIMFKYLSK